MKNVQLKVLNNCKSYNYNIKVMGLEGNSTMFNRHVHC